jgi:hypothetical protein
MANKDSTCTATLKVQCLEMARFLQLVEKYQGRLHRSFTVTPCAEHVWVGVTFPEIDYLNQFEHEFAEKVDTNYTSRWAMLKKQIVALLK